MFIGHGPSNLPEDRIVNVFHFSTDGEYDDDRVTAHVAVDDFYTGANIVQPIGAYLSAWVQRICETRTYNLEDPKPRLPQVGAITLPAPSQASGLPEEVACCLTLQGAIPPAASARRRGRLYIGPLNLTAATFGTALVASRPSDIFVNDLVVAATRLRNNSLGWAIRSSLPVQNFVEVDHGYVDNAFDTQRRRGPRTTSRVLWP